MAAGGAAGGEAGMSGGTGVAGTGRSSEGVEAASLFIGGAFDEVGVPIRDEEAESAGGPE